MEIKVKKTIGSADRTTATLDLVGSLKIPEATKTRIKNDVGDFLVEQIIKSAGRAESPVQGGEWEKKLSKQYAAKKKAEGLGTKANLEFEGDLLDALTFEETQDGIEVGWIGEQAGKADGHNNFSGKSSLPRRQGLPDEGEGFKPSINNEIEKIIADHIADSIEFEADDFEDVSSKSELYTVLDEFFPDLTKTEIKMAVTRVPGLARLLDELDLLELL
jgi:hypothetical protein